ncbi:hypothetical protein SERLA73DRAFT_192105 [Serpula lacrymans var. lacrymans S7.3]|uniref:Uncharacterized protein n=2 Tax=Serpula lacrymans var. lacrymans TaxID=341189 RepID=F8QJ03_SERL3|nr:uncharacterized protein SERLADRAFT_457018 [Serpula lacrymans var. lacrymans S7.9]EGN91715.1 hypothetical protein SERLA73DRAFT_192105 [Serpula lacrymans var. lacrymans S7.3]EGO29375.1 hypothetical protein SERLADRAFT_457018 [Serpula lacrymans var. lacrymans S7.9]
MASLKSSSSFITPLTFDVCDRFDVRVRDVDIHGHPTTICLQTSPNSNQCFKLPR